LIYVAAEVHLCGTGKWDADDRRPIQITATAAHSVFKKLFLWQGSRGV
jgi:hypothetical protein